MPGIVEGVISLEMPSKCDILILIISGFVLQIKLLAEAFRNTRLGGEWFDLSAEEISYLGQQRFPKQIKELIIKDY